jgi:hypothetical protein
VDAARVEAAIGAVESDPKAMEAVQAIVEMYGEALARIAERLDAHELLGDELVEHLLLVHDLHPVPLEERVRGVLDEGVELLSLEDGTARLRLDGRPLGPALEAAIRKAAPEVEEVVADGAPKPTLLQLPVAGQEPAEACDLCGSAVPPEHRHLLDLRNRELLCACQPCRILFDSGAAGGTHYRLVPDRRLHLADFDLDDATWAELLIPVDMAFFFRQACSSSTRGRSSSAPTRC